MMNIVAHNLLAMNADRQFNIVNKKRAKSTEKLSSGYKINRAAHDAAGLSVSEKMRRQIRGLTQGIRNTQEGISVCQVADGALEEVTEILQRMNELSVQAANGTLTAEDRNVIDEEVKALKAEINRISEDTTFNEISLFDGNKGYSGGSAGGTSGTLASDGYVVSSFPTGAVTRVDAAYLSGCASTVVNGVTHYTLGSGIYQIDSSVTNAVFELSGDTVIKDSALTDVALNCAAGTHLFVDDLKLDYSGAVEVDAIKFNGKGNALTFAGSNKIDIAMIDEGAGVCVSAGTDLMIEGTGKLDIDTNWGAGIGGSCLASDPDYGDIVINCGVFNIESNLGAGIGSAGNTLWNHDLNGHITINGGTVTSSAYNGAGIGSGGSGFYSYCSNCNYSGGNIIINGGNITACSWDAGAGIGGGEDCGGANVTITGGKVYAYGSGLFSDGYNSAGGAGIGVGCVAMIYGENVSPLSIFIGTLNITGGEITSCGSKVGDYSFITGGLSGAAYPLPLGLGAITCHTAQQASDYLAKYNSADYTADGVPITLADLQAEKESFGTMGTRYVYKYKGNSSQPGIGTGMTGSHTGKELRDIWIQSGNEAGVGMFINLYAMNTGVLGIDSLHCRTQKAAERAIGQVKTALTEISRQRSSFGAAQNRLGHTVANESNIVENTTAAESRIRDTDVAEEMVTLSNENILAQAGQSMLTQANQTRQYILSLLF